MRRFLSKALHRHEKHSSLMLQCLAGLGAALALLAVGLVAQLSGLPFLFGPFGASTVLLFGHPASPLAQPINILGGYALATVMSIAALMLFPAYWEAAAIAVGLSVSLMLLLRVTHPPAGAVPLVAFGNHLSGGHLLLVVLGGSCVLVALALFYHAIARRHTYPLPPVN